MENDDLLAAAAAAIPPELAAVATAKDCAASDLMKLEHVVGVGVGYRWTHGHRTPSPAVLVLVDTKTDDAAPVPSTVGGFPTDVLAVGGLVAGRGSSSEKGPVGGVLAARVRPLRPGLSVGHASVTSGTIGATAYDRPTGRPQRHYLLSNSHVLADSGDAEVGDRIVQPGPADGGSTSADTVGRLARFVPIAFDGSTNVVDAAVAQVPVEAIDRDTYWDGYPASAARPATVGMRLRKTGRTTSTTTGRVTAVGVTADVSYGDGRVARFENQVLATAMASGGDSGSLVFDTANHPVGLLFAGSDVATLLNPIAEVQLALGVRIWP